MKLLVISHGRLIANGTAGQAVSCGMIEAALDRGWGVSHVAVVAGPAASWEIPKSFDRHGAVREVEATYESRPEASGQISFARRVVRYIDHFMAVYDPTRVRQFSGKAPALLGETYDGVIAMEPLPIELARKVAAKRTVAILGDPTGRRIWHSALTRDYVTKLKALIWDVAEPFHFRRIIPKAWQVAMFGSGHAAGWARLMGRPVLDLRPPLPVEASTADVQQDKIVVLFGGTLASTASRKSLDPIFDEIIPALQTGFAGKPFELRLVGECPQFLAERASHFPEVRITGKVASFEDELAQGHIFLLPMNYPVGVRTRLCSALAAGNVCIVHPSVTYNMPELAECPAVIVEGDVSRYASIIAKALEPETFGGLRAAARAFFNEHYTAQAAAARLLNCLEEGAHG